MKVLYLIHQFFPEHRTGTERVIFNLSSMMQKAGHAVRVVTYSFYKDAFYDKKNGNILLKEFVYRGVPVTALRHTKMPKNRDFRLVDRALLSAAEEVLADQKPDIVHVAHLMRVCEFIAVCDRMNIPYLMTLTDFWLICPNINLINSRRNLCKGPDRGRDNCRLCYNLPLESLKQRHDRVPSLLSRAKEIVVPSHFVKNMFINAGGPTNIRVIGHGIRRALMRKRAKLYRRDDPVIFCYAGSFNYHKGVHVLLRAFVQSRSSRISLNLYGTVPDSPYVNSLYEIAKLDPRIHFCGAYLEEDTEQVLSQVDVIVIPSVCYETYCLVMHEAIVNRIPVIVSDVGVMSEKVRDGVNGFTFPINDSGALANILNRIADDPEILNSLRDNSRSAVIPSIEQEAAAYEALYSQIKSSQGT